MKKIAYELSYSLNNMNGIKCRVTSSKYAIKHISEVDIIHYIGGPTYKSIIFCFICRLKKRSLKTILTFSNPIWSGVADRLFNNFTPNHIIVFSERWIKWAENKHTPYSFMSLSGVNLNKFTPVNKSEKILLRKKYNLPVDKIIILHVGHLKFDRNLEVLSDTEKNIQVLIVGSTTTKHSRELVDILKNKNFIIFDEYIPCIEEIYQASDCYVFPTVNSESAVQIPLSIIEAMSVNLPVISTKYGGLDKLFKPDENILYIDNREFNNLTLYAKIAISSQKNNRSYIEQYSWEHISSKLVELYRQIIKSKKQRLLVSLFGPDGSGKSTIRKLLQERLEFTDINVESYHWRPRIIPPKNNNELVNNVIDKNIKIRNTFVSFFIYLTIYIDFFLFYFLKYMSNKRDGNVIIYERYFYDIMFHPERYRLKKLKVVAKYLSMIMPKPDLIILLTGAPEVIMARKNELTIDEISTQQHRMKKYLPSFSNCICIDATKNNPSEIVDIIFNNIDLLI